MSYKSKWPPKQDINHLKLTGAQVDLRIDQGQLEQQVVTMMTPYLSKAEGSIDTMVDMQELDSERSLGKGQIWAIGGGKGGIGKSFVTSNTAVNLAQRFPNKRIVVVDADLGGANVHTCLGIAYPERSLADFIEGRAATLDDIAIETSIPNLQIISGASDMLSLANPQWAQKQKLLRHLRRLKADYLLLDLGAGTTYNVLDFFNIATRKLVVVTPEPTSIQNAYGFIKSAMFRFLYRSFSSNQMVTDLLMGGREFGGPNPPETIRQISNFLLARIPEVGEQFQALAGSYSISLVLNMANPPQDKQAYRVVRTVAKGYLDLDLDYLGSIPKDEKIPQSVDQMRPLLLSYPECKPASQLRSVVDRLISPQKL